MRAAAYLCGAFDGRESAAAAFDRFAAEDGESLWASGASIADRYVRANVAPSDRFTRSPAGGTRHRLRAGESGFENLYLAGDWVDNGFNLASIEGATMSGLQAAAAICS